MCECVSVKVYRERVCFRGEFPDPFLRPLEEVGLVFTEVLVDSGLSRFEVTVVFVFTTRTGLTQHSWIKIRLVSGSLWWVFLSRFDPRVVDGVG